ncbi:MAG: hotdog domain-containing protein, partial [Methylocella sp.]
EFLRALGIEHNGNFAHNADSFHFVVRAMAIDFLKPALMDDLLLVVTRISVLGGASIAMCQEIQRNGHVLLTAKVKIAFVSGGKPHRIPVEVMAKLKATARSPHV